MPALHGPTTHLKRPSIYEIVATILTTPPTCSARRTHSLSQPTRSSYHPKKSRRAPSLSRSSHATTTAYSPPRPRTLDRGPVSTETTQTDFSRLDVLGGTPVPSTAVDACVWDGFHLSNGVKITQGAGALLVAGEAFGWRPWDAGKGRGQGKRLLNARGRWEVADEAWGLLEIVWPKPDLLILGLGPSMAPLSPATRKFISNLGIRIDVQDTRNASAQFNLLATERGVGTVAAALIPLGWREGVGVK